MTRLFCLFCMVMMIAGVPAVSALSVVTTTSVLWDPVREIGGDEVSVVYISDPTICPHLQGDILPGLIQKNAEALEAPDLFMAHNATVDMGTMAAIEKFRDANEYGETEWLEFGTDEWNTPATAEKLAGMVLDWLTEADPEHADLYAANAAAYSEKIALAGTLSLEEQDALSQKQAIVIAWQKLPAEEWLGLTVYDFFAPEFAFGGNKTPAKVVDALQAKSDEIKELFPASGTEKLYIIENMQSGELAKGIEEALGDMSVPVERVVFTNFPLSVEGVSSIPDVLAYNKKLLLE
ncbi:MAG: zinc ABC transporter substrate-binding protein [Methanospirillaceae archaeon]|nr:zinc ABC transporter substrate-binding protein [Methanospirillaceae archaeon]